MHVHSLLKFKFNLLHKGLFMWQLNWPDITLTYFLLNGFCHHKLGHRCGNRFVWILLVDPWVTVMCSLESYAAVFLYQRGLSHLFVQFVCHLMDFVIIYHYNIIRDDNWWEKMSRLSKWAWPNPLIIKEFVLLQMLAALLCYRFEVSCS